MTSKLSENLRFLRKSQNMTQQTLADAMGVTVGAVHKWEQGLSTPDIGVIMDLAGFFGVSVDALVGYRMEPREKSQILEQLQSIRLHKNYAESWDRVERWLRQYPNDFDIVSLSGTLYHLAGVETGDPGQLNRAIGLLRHAANLAPGEQTELHTRIGLALLDLGRRQEGLQELRSHNPCGIHNDTIGMELSDDPQCREEAAHALSLALLQAVLSLHRIGSGFVNIAFGTEDYIGALEILRWMDTTLESLEIPGRVNFLRKDRAVFLAMAAAAESSLGHREEARALMARSRQAAQEFDAAPDYTTRSLRFCAMEPVATFDGSGATAREAVRNALEELNAGTLWEE